MKMKMKHRIGALALIMSSSMAIAADGITITTKNSDPIELAVKTKLENLITRYQLSPFFFTKKVLVDKDSWPPHSHPILTMPGNKRFVDDENDLMANFLHEQFHWAVTENPHKTSTEMAALLRTHFPDVMTKRPYGSGDEMSTYIHILVCYFEYKAMVLKIGEENAMRMIKAKPYYTWVYALIADKANHAAIEKVILESGGTMWPKN